MNVRDELRKRFSRMIKGGSVHDRNTQATQEYQATTKPNTPLSENNATKNIEA
jgi:hypothetical protein